MSFSWFRALLDQKSLFRPGDQRLLGGKVGVRFRSHLRNCGSGKLLMRLLSERLQQDWRGTKKKISRDAAAIIFGPQPTIGRRRTQTSRSGSMDGGEGGG